MAIHLRALIGKLNQVSRNALEAAAGLCVTRTHYDVEIEHFLLKLLDVPGSDFGMILRHFEVNTSRLSEELTRSLDRLKRGNARTPEFSPTLMQMLQEAWSYGSLERGDDAIRSGYAIVALASVDSLSRLIRGVSKEIEKIDAEELRRNFATILGNSEEQPEGAKNAEETSEAPRTVAGKTPFLDGYTVDLTANARAGKIDPVLARDFEIRQVVDILTRRRQNNPILVGEAGVGKTAIVEGFALRVAKGDVPCRCAMSPYIRWIWRCCRRELV